MLKGSAIIAFLLVFSSHVLAYDLLDIRSIYIVDGGMSGVGIGLGNKATDDELSLITYPVSKSGLSRYIDGDAGYFNSGRVYLLGYEKRVGLAYANNFYYSWGYSIGGVYLSSNYFDETHPLLLGKMGLGARKKMMNGEVYIETSLYLGVSAYIQPLADLLLLKFRPEITVEAPIYFGYRANI